MWFSCLAASVIFQTLAMIWEDNSCCFLFSFLQAASSGKYVDACLEMLVSNFMPPPRFIPILGQPRIIAKKGQVLSRVHSALQDIAYLVPLSPMRLLSLVIDRRPFHRKKLASEIVSSILLHHSSL